MEGKTSMSKEKTEAVVIKEIRLECIIFEKGDNLRLISVM